jgi:hypothetical protein
MTLARWPNEGFVDIERLVEAGSPTAGKPRNPLSRWRTFSRSYVDREGGRAGSAGNPVMPANVRVISRLLRFSDRATVLLARLRRVEMLRRMRSF